MTVILYKNEGETPLEALDRLRLEKPQYKDEILSYAGRLDPMAEGVLLVLVGEEENKRRVEFLSLDKVYEAEILIGVSTDSHDVLGRITQVADTSEFDLARAVRMCESLKGTFNQEYPAFSSKTVDGKSLFQWAREGKIDSVVIPTKSVHIYDSNVIGRYVIDVDELCEQALERISRVQGDFRQYEIKGDWEALRIQHQLTSYPVLRMRIACSSGTYIRGIAKKIGEELGYGAFLWKLQRISIG